MSTTYPDLPNTNYPDSIDHFEDMVDVNATIKPLIDYYYSLYNASDFAGINALINSNPSLNNALFNAIKYNRLKDTVEAQGRLYKSDIQTYLMNIIKNKGDYVSTTKYTKYDVVGYVVGSAKQYFMGISSNIPVGTLPTDTNYFIALTLRGEQGASGTGLSYRKGWNSTTQYYTNDCVSYNNILWSANSNNLNSEPTTSNSNWTKIMDVHNPFIMSASQPSGQNIGDYWFQII